MVEAICTRLIEDKYGRLNGYRLLYNDGNYEDIEEYTLAEKVRNNEIAISNLTYNERYGNFSFNTQCSRENYLNNLIQSIYKDCNIHKYCDNTIKITSLQDWINKSTLLGLNVEEIELYNRQIIYYVKIRDDFHQIYIPDDITCLNKPITKYIPSYSDSGSLKLIHEDLPAWNNYIICLLKLRGTVSFLGGRGLIDVHNMFGVYNTSLNIDLTKLYLNNVVDFYGMFYQCKLNSVTFGTVKLNNKASMLAMFYNAVINEIHMNNVYTDNVITFENMFRRCESKMVDIENFDASEALKYKRDALDYMFSNSNINLKTNCKYILEAFNANHIK